MQKHKPRPKHGYRFKVEIEFDIAAESIERAWDLAWREDRTRRLPIPSVRDRRRIQPDHARVAQRLSVVISGDSHGTLMIRSADLYPGDTLQHRDGYRTRIVTRINGGWETGDVRVGNITDSDIERCGPDRVWWLDDAERRP